jgi:transposase
MDQWVKDWVNQQKKLGEKCIEIKYINGKPYVYRSTSRYDKVTKGPKKVSEYMGRLFEKEGFVPKGEKPKHVDVNVKSVTEYGNSLLIKEEFDELIEPLKEAFPQDWQEIVAMVITRVDGYSPLKRIKDRWDKLTNHFKITPNCDPKILGGVLYRLGQDRIAQDRIFSCLSKNDSRLIYDLSYVFSESNSVQLSEKGYNGKHKWLPQINIALFSGVESGLPLMIRGIPGSVKDVKTLEKSLTEFDAADVTLIMDRGFISEALLPLFEERRISYVQPLRRNSDMYKLRIHLTKHFTYHKRLIHCGKRKVENSWIYSFKDMTMASFEEYQLYEELDKDTTKKEDFDQKIKKAGMIIIRSNKDVEPQDIYDLYKSRDLVEKHFETFKSELHADKVYLNDSFSIFGHFFTGFLALYLYCKILNRLRKAEINNRFSPKDALIKLSKVYRIDFESHHIITEIPKQVGNLSDAINLRLIPID